MDVFEDEYEQFQADVHILIKRTLHATIEHLVAKAACLLASSFPASLSRIH